MLSIWAFIGNFALSPCCLMISWWYKNCTPCTNNTAAPISSVMIERFIMFWLLVQSSLGIGWGRVHIWWWSFLYWFYCFHMNSCQWHCWSILRCGQHKIYYFLSLADGIFVLHFVCLVYLFICNIFQFFGCPAEFLIIQHKNVILIPYISEEHYFLHMMTNL